MDAVNPPVFIIPLWAALTAVALGGVQGALFASGFQGQRRLDLLGVAIIGILLGMGGGLIRDLLLGLTPATLQNNWYLLTATVASLVGMLLSGIFQRLNRAIVLLDAVVIGLFGAFGTADIMFAPVVTRFVTYSLPVARFAPAYMNAVLQHPFMQDWIAAAQEEDWVIQQFEMDQA